jgi:lipopolysaccharide transport system ATP-binding protein
MPTDLVLRTEDLGKAYRVFHRPQDRLKQILMPWRRFYVDFWALRDVSLEVGRGEAIGLVGRNGAGKSTFLQLASGTIEPTAGTVERHGRIAALLELGSGFNPEFTGRENVMLSAMVMGLSKRQVEERFQSITDFAAIGDFIEMPVKTYSSGMYARLAFAVAAHVDADIMIVDEILSVGDIAFAQKCMRFIRGFRERGTLLFVSHSPDSVLALCDRAVWLDRGEVRDIGPGQTGVSRLHRLAESRPGRRLGVSYQGWPPQKQHNRDRSPRGATRGRGFGKRGARLLVRPTQPRFWAGRRQHR